MGLNFLILHSINFSIEISMKEDSNNSYQIIALVFTSSNQSQSRKLGSDASHENFERTCLWKNLNTPRGVNTRTVLVMFCSL